MTISVYWAISNYFGDALVPWMVQKLTGVLPTWAPPGESGFVLGGSVLNHAGEGTVCWGAGLASMGDQVNQKADIRAFRGPLSRMIAAASGAKGPEVYGDAAMLLPEIYSPDPNKLWDLGVVPHYVDQQRTWNWFRNAQISKHSVRLINVFAPIEDGIDQIASCRRVLSSSLHGLVVAHAYGVPALWAKISDSLGGDGSKFRDHLMSVDLPVYEPLDLRTAWHPPHALCAAVDSTHPPKPFDTTRLREAFPL